MSTPDLAIAHISSSQNQKEVTANAAFDTLDLALTNEVTIALTDAPYALSTALAYTSMCFVFTGALTANRLVTVPSTKKLYIVWNQTTGGQSLTFGASLIGRTAAVAPLASPAAFNILYCDGVNVDFITNVASVPGSLSSEAVVNLVANNSVLDSTKALGNLALLFTGTLTTAGSVQIPSSAKLYLVWNETAGGFPLTLYTANSPTGRVATLPNASSPVTFWWVYCDGFNVDILNPPPPSEVTEIQAGNNTILANQDVENNLAFKFTGALTQHGSVQIPTSQRLYIFWNNTTSPFNMTFYLANSPSGRTAVVPYSATPSYWLVFCDGVNVDVVGSRVIGGATTKAGNTQGQMSDGGQTLVWNTAVPSTYTLPSTPPSAQWFVILRNTGTGALTVSRNGLTIDSRTANLTLYQGDSVMISTDNTNYLSSSARPLSFGIFVPSTMSNAQVLMYLKMDRPCIFPASAPNSLAAASIAATGSTTITLKKNGASFCTVVFAASGTTGTFTQAADATFAAGDLLEIDGPATADGTLANVGITLQGFRF